MLLYTILYLLSIKKKKFFSSQKKKNLWEKTSNFVCFYVLVEKKMRIRNILWLSQ